MNSSLIFNTLKTASKIQYIIAVLSLLTQLLLKKCIMWGKIKLNFITNRRRYGTFRKKGKKVEQFIVCRHNQLHNKSSLKGVKDAL